MIEIAGLLLTGLSTLNDLATRYQDLSRWTEEDLLVDGDYLDLALAKGVLKGQPGDFLWSKEDAVATRTLRGTAEVVIAYNEHTRVRRRLCRGKPGDMLILLRKTGSETR